MQIDLLPDSRIGDLVAIYNAHVANIPLCDPTSSPRFSEAPSWRDSEQEGRVHEQALLVAIEHREPVGFVHLAIGRFPGPELRGDQSERETGTIRFFAYPRGRREVGQSLLHAAEAHLSARDVGRILAFPNTGGYVFHRYAFGELSDRCGHVVALLGMNGYDIARGEVFFGWRDYETVTPEPVDKEAEVTVRQVHEKRDCLPGVSVTVKLRGQLVGVCEVHSFGNWGWSSESQATFGLGPIDVEASFQGQGWGRFLLQTACAEARQIGYRHMATSTDWRNFRARLFYANYGCDDLDTAYSFLKELR